MLGASPGFVRSLLMSRLIRVSLGEADLANLRALYAGTVSEITNLRDHEWRITQYFLLLSAGFIGLIVTPDVRALVTWKLRVLITALQSLAMIISVFFLNRTHYHLTKNRQLRREIEDILHFFDRGAYVLDDSVLPGRWKARKVTYIFQWFDLVVPFMMVTVLAQLASIYLLWKLK